VPHHHLGPNPCAPPQAKPSESKVPELEQLLAARDYAGAIALLAWKRSSGHADVRHGEDDDAERRQRQRLLGWQLAAC
jgi:hypothetical protein